MPSAQPWRRCPGRYGSFREGFVWLQGPPTTRRNDARPPPSPVPIRPSRRYPSAPGGVQLQGSKPSIPRSTILPICTATVLVTRSPPLWGDQALHRHRFRFCLEQTCIALLNEDDGCDMNDNGFASAWRPATLSARSSKIRFGWDLLLGGQSIANLSEGKATSMSGVQIISKIT